MRRTISAARQDDPGGVVAFRRACLERVGFEAALADALARDRAVDVHALLGLVERGCPPALAVRILAPLDAPAPAR